MSPRGSLIARLFLGLLTVAAFELRCGQCLPSWLQVPLLQLQGLSGGRISENEVPTGPEGLLVTQLKNVDETRDPETARTLHAGIARILRAEGKDIERAIKHFEAARNAAVRTEDADTILEARLELSEVLIEAGRPQEVDHELDGTLRLLNPENFWEYSVKLDRTKGLASFDDGSIELALEYFEDAANVAVQPEDIVRCAVNIAMAQACLGRAQRSLPPLRKAMEVLENARSSDIMPDDLHDSLAMEVHSRLAETFHAMGDVVSAKAHYKKASPSHLEAQGLTTQRVLAIKKSINHLENGAGPELRCPGGAHSQSFKLRTQTDAGKALKAKVASLLEEGQYKKAEFELWNYLEAQPQPYKNVEAISALTSLGNIYLSSERRSYYKASRCFMQALQASLAGSHTSEAKAAFKELSYIQDMLPEKDQPKVAAAMQKYLEADDKFGSSASDLGQNEKLIIEV